MGSGRALSVSVCGWGEAEGGEVASSGRLWSVRPGRGAGVRLPSAFGLSTLVGGRAVSQAWELLGESSFARESCVQC